MKNNLIEAIGRKRHAIYHRQAAPKVKYPCRIKKHKNCVSIHCTCWCHAEITAPAVKPSSEENHD